MNKQIEDLLTVCKVARRAIIDLAYLASQLSETDIEETANQPFNEDGYAYLANRQLDKIIAQVEEALNEKNEQG